MESELTTQVDEVLVPRVFSKLLHPLQAVVSFLFFLQVFFNGCYFVAVRICAFYDVEFPLRGVKVGRGAYIAAQAIVTKNVDKGKFVKGIL